jgi:endonuclease/exonuclease/phosphatase family metal-dependent hydrolase
VKLVLAIVLLLLAPIFADAAELKIATWNLDWLTAGANRFLPPDVVPRSDEDRAILAQYARDLNADVVAIEEVDGFPAASKVFSTEEYSIHMTGDRVVQRVGLVVRHGLRYDVNSDVTALSANHLRSGADITLHLGRSDLRMLAVHLKKGCPDAPMTKAKGQACEELRDQIGPLTEWIEARRAEGMAFIVLGDFNRRMGKSDTFLARLEQAAPLRRATEGRSSPCWGRENFIDHILAGGAAADWMQPETLRVLTYRQTDPTWKDRLSDHCPVSVRLTVPE